MNEVVREIMQEERDGAEECLRFYEGAKNKTYLQVIGSGFDMRTQAMMDEANFEFAKLYATEKYEHARARIAIADCILMGRPIVSEEVTPELHAV